MWNRQRTVQGVGIRLFTPSGGQGGFGEGEKPDRSSRSAFVAGACNATPILTRGLGVQHARCAGLGVKSPPSSSLSLAAQAANAHVRWHIELVGARYQEC